LLVLLAARTAIDSAVTHAATEGKPLDAKLVVDVMNLLTSRADLQDLCNLRLVCKLTYRGSFPVPSYPLLELPTGVVESFVGGSCSNKVPCAAIAVRWRCTTREQLQPQQQRHRPCRRMPHWQAYVGGGAKYQLALLLL
jgi:hypothetical protein